MTDFANYTCWMTVLFCKGGEVIGVIEGEVEVGDGVCHCEIGMRRN